MSTPYPSPNVAPRLLSVNTVFVSLLVLAFVLRIMFAFSSLRVSHDPAISYLVANGNQIRWQEYETDYRQGDPQIVQAQELRTLFFAEDVTFDPVTVTRGLYRADIHPPLYFLSLNAWLSVWGASNIAYGALLNIVFDLITCLLLAIFVLRAVGSGFAAQIAVLLWLFNTAVFETSVYVRQYALLGCCAIVLGTSFYLWLAEDQPTTPSRRYGWGILTVVSLFAGLMTHYWFLIPSGVLGLYGLVQLAHNRRILTHILIYAFTILVTVGMWFRLGILNQIVEVAGRDDYNRTELFFNGLIAMSKFFVDSRLYDLFSRDAASRILGIQPIPIEVVYRIAATVILVA